MTQKWSEVSVLNGTQSPKKSQNKGLELLVTHLPVKLWQWKGLIKGRSWWLDHYEQHHWGGKAELVPQYLCGSNSQDMVTNQRLHPELGKAV